jgi:hypothetical protein
MPLVGEIVKTASMLSAIAELELDIMGPLLLLHPPSSSDDDQAVSWSRWRTRSCSSNSFEQVRRVVLESLVLL